MNRLSTLGALIAGVITLTVFYGAAVGDGDSPASIDIDDGEGVHHIVKGDRGSFSLNRDGLKIKAVWRGAYELTAEGDDIASLDHKLEISRKTESADERVIFERDGDVVVRKYYRDGEKQVESAETDAAARALLTAYLEASGSKAKERVTILLRNGGPDAVIGKIDSIAGDHARLRYVAELTEQSDLNDAEMQALFNAIKNFEGDHDLRVALDSILEHESVTPSQMPLFLDAARRIESDYDVRRLIESVAEKPLNDDSIMLAIELLDNLESSHDLRRASEALLKQKSLSAENAARLLNTIGERIESDHDLRLLLNDSRQYLTRGEAAATAWTGAFRALTSDHDRRVTLESAADIKDLDAGVIETLIAAAEQIDADHDRRLALQAYAGLVDGDATLQSAYERAARGIESESDRRRALAAIGAAD